MNHDFKNTYPLPNCWLEDYKVLAYKAGLDRFPTHMYLRSRPQRAAEFCKWIRKQLSLSHFRPCAGNSPCLVCNRNGGADAKYVAISTLAKTVSKVDPELSRLLTKKAKGIPTHRESSSSQLDQPSTTNTYPLPDCWLENYKAIAKELELTRFPYAGYFSLTFPWKAIPFADWVGHQLRETTKKCRGLDRTNCPRCKLSGYPEDKAMAVLANIVCRKKLSLMLSERAQQLGYKPKQPDPGKSDTPFKTPAVAMPIPKPRLRTDAIAKQGKQGKSKLVQRE